ncbi:MAG TPA: DinB family protein [Gemmatimonadales bacterium]|nr:DinB family protein [Gemmatimonadales bacterium]
MQVTWIAAAFARDLKSLKREVAAYPDEADLWTCPAGVTNPGGNLALHLAGNVQYFIGTLLGGSGYVRNRDAEFSRKGVPRAEVLREIDAALAALQLGLGRISEADLGRPYPAPIGGQQLTIGDALLHLVTHLTYHVGQVDYHRRIVTGRNTAVGTVPLTEMATAKPAT